MGIKLDLSVFGGGVPNKIFKITVLLEWEDSFESDSQLHDTLLEFFFDA